METKYFASAWNDIKNSPKWFGKIALLSLVALIPIFGWIVVAGYLYGWAGRIAWGVHDPMPKKIFDREDKDLYRRGFFALVIVLAITFTVGVITLIIDKALGVSYASGMHRSLGAVSGGFFSNAGISSVIDIVVSVIATVIAAICCVRMTIYNRLSAGFQFGRVFKMMRHDANGTFRLMGLAVVSELIATVIICFVAFVFTLALLALCMGVATSAGVSDIFSMSASMWSYAFSNSSPMAVVAVLLLFLAMLFVCIMAFAFASLLVVRAAGYWVFQFDVPKWGKQDDPMPFEREGSR